MKRFYAPLIRLWPTVVEFASDVGCPERTAREWVRIDSVPAAWFNAIAQAAAKRPEPDIREIKVELLADIAERRRLEGETVRRTQQNPAAA